MHIRLEKEAVLADISESAGASADMFTGDSEKLGTGGTCDQRKISSAKYRIFVPGNVVRRYRPRDSGGNRIKSVAPGTKPEPWWCPAGLTHTQKQRVQRLRAVEIKNKMAEKKRDELFSRDRPMVPTKT